jgi:hypothetical protein
MVGPRHFHRVEICALKIFYQRQDYGFFIPAIANDGLNRFQPRLFCCTPTPFTGNELIDSVAFPAHENRLQQSTLFQGSREFYQFLRVKRLSRLISIRYNRFDPQMLNIRQL